MPAFAKLVQGSITKSALGEAAGPSDTRPMSVEKNQGSDPYGLREGEVAVALPERFDASLYFIGRIRTPWTRREDCPKNGREAEAICTIELDSRWAQGLQGLETSSHVVVLYWMDRARRDLVLQKPGSAGQTRGTFALRSPMRPNPIASSVVALVERSGAVLTVRGLDCVDGTPLIDLKPERGLAETTPA